MGLGASERLPILMGEPNRVGSFLPQPLYMRSAPSISVVVNIKGGGSSMKIRVYINSDPRSSHLFGNIDKVIDGSDNALIDGSRKLVLMRKKETSKDSSITSKDVLYDTIAVFNHWTFWRQV